jgi:hypothetical protein
VARSTAETKYRTMAHGVSEGLWLRRLLLGLGLFEDKPIMLYCDNNTAINIANNPIQHDRTKHVEIATGVRIVATEIATGVRVV